MGTFPTLVRLPDGRHAIYLSKILAFSIAGPEKQKSRYWINMFLSQASLGNIKPVDNANDAQQIGFFFIKYAFTEHGYG